MSKNLHAALEDAGALQRVLSLGELVEAAHLVVARRTRYRHAWLALFEPEATHARVVQFAGARREVVLRECPLVPIAGDPMVEEIRAGRSTVVVVDACSDPRTNKDIVARVGNRSIVNVPLVLGQDLLGALGAGTFGDEPLVTPTAEELELLSLLGAQLASAYSRLRIAEQEREDADARARLERHLESLHRVELMGVLASGVAHDLANYLGVIRTNVEFLEGEGRDLALLRQVGLAAERATGVTRQLLALGRAQADRRVPVDLNERVESTLHLVRPALPRGARVQHAAGPAPRVEAVPAQIDQVLANLVLNAADAIGAAGSIEIGVDERVIGPDFVREHPWARPGRFGHVSVRDDGCGIPPEHLPRIFDPLFSTKSRGSGLGLAVVSRFVEQHAGLVHCRSAPGAGTTFDVYLPAGGGAP